MWYNIATFEGKGENYEINIEKVKISSCYDFYVNHNDNQRFKC